MKKQSQIDQVAAGITPPFGRAHILCAEDDPAVNERVRQHLDRAGYEVTSVRDGQQAWEALQADSYDLLITDSQMPGMTGAELVLKARLAGLTLPVIVVGADLQYFTHLNGRSLHVAALLQKPFGPKELSDAVVMVLRAERSNG